MKKRFERALQKTNDSAYRMSKVLDCFGDCYVFGLITSEEFSKGCDMLLELIEEKYGKAKLDEVLAEQNRACEEEYEECEIDYE